MLMLTDMSGFGSRYRPAASISFTASAVDATNTNIYTYSSQALGAAHPGRVIIVCVATVQTGTGNTISSVTVGGITATLQKTASNLSGGNEGIAAIYTARVPTGTTGDVVVTSSGTQLRCGVGIFRAVNIQPTAYATDDDVAGSLSATVLAGGVAVCGVHNNSTSSTFATSGLTEAYDEVIEAPGSHTGASGAFAAPQTVAVTITPSTSWGNAGVMVLATFPRA